MYRTKLRFKHPHYQTLHSALVKEAGDILGVDIDEEGITAMKAAGFNVEASGRRTMNLGRRFNDRRGRHHRAPGYPGLFLSNMHLHLEGEGELLIHDAQPFQLQAGVENPKRNRIRFTLNTRSGFAPRSLSDSLRFATSR